jgi:hypothetical protein
VEDCSKGLDATWAWGARDRFITGPSPTTRHRPEIGGGLLEMVRVPPAVVYSTPPARRPHGSAVPVWKTQRADDATLDLLRFSPGRESPRCCW